MQDDEQWEHGYYEEDENWLEEAPDYEAYDEGQDFDCDGTMVRRNPGPRTVLPKWPLPMMPPLPPTRVPEDDSKS